MYYVLFLELRVARLLFSLLEDVHYNKKGPSNKWEVLHYLESLEYMEYMQHNIGFSKKTDSKIQSFI